MVDKLPLDFDADWYAATYADVAMSGLDPREHYRRFGRLLGRRSAGPAPTVESPVAPSPPRTAEKIADPAPTTRKSPKPRPSAPGADTVFASPAPIIERPPGFDPGAAIARPATPKESSHRGGGFRLADFAKAGTGSAALLACDRLLKLNLPGLRKGSIEPSCNALPFQTGASRIADARLVNRSTLRLTITGGTEAAGWAFRLFQSKPSAPAEFVMLGQGVQLPSAGPVIHDVELIHSLMPLVLELSDAGGTTSALTLMPFPSLLPGGFHWAELKASQTEANPMNDFWAMSESLLKQALDEEGAGDRLVASLDAQALPEDVQEWLGAIFGPLLNSGSGSRAALALPAGWIPTLCALVAHRIPSAEDRPKSDVVLVADAESHRPRWSIAMPAHQGDNGAIPALHRSASADDAAWIESAPIPLGISMRGPVSSTPSSALAQPINTGPLTIIVDASDPERLDRLIRSIRETVGVEIEWLVAIDDIGPDLSAVVDHACEGGSWGRVRRGLRSIARDARHETLVTISDRIAFDQTAFAVVLNLLERDITTASASCALLAEKIIKKNVVLQPASGGLFPVGVSFAAGPRLAFGEPNALDALPNHNYPVAANTLMFTAWRRRALAGLPLVPDEGPVTVEDIRIGLDLMRAGFSNWCTTTATAQLSGPYVPRDVIDPVGPGYLPAHSWEEILKRVTLVRELF